MVRFVIPGGGSGRFRGGYWGVRPSIFAENLDFFNVNSVFPRPLKLAVPTVFNP